MKVPETLLIPPNLTPQRNQKQYCILGGIDATKYWNSHDSYHIAI